MGSSASKAARGAGSAARQYPTRIPKATQSPGPSTSATATSTSNPPPNLAQNNQSPPQSNLSPEAPPPSFTKTPEIDKDASDPALNARLRNIGPVRPTPHFSPSSQSPMDPHPDAIARPIAPTFPSPSNNPALAILEARNKFQEKADAEFDAIGTRSFEGRTLLDAGTIRQVLVLRDERGKSEGDIESLLGLRKGVVGVLGGRGLVGAAAGLEEGFDVPEGR